MEVYFCAMLPNGPNLGADQVAGQIGRNTLAAVAQAIAKAGAVLGVAGAKRRKREHGHRRSHHHLDDLRDSFGSAEGSVVPPPFCFQGMGLVRISMPPAPLPSKVFAERPAGGEVEQGVSLGCDVDLLLA